MELAPVVLVGDYAKIVPTLHKKYKIIVLDPFFTDWEKVVEYPWENLLLNSGFLIIFSNRPYTGYVQVTFDSRLTFVTEMIWAFANGTWVSSKLPRVCHRNILIYTKNGELNDCKILRWIEKPHSTKRAGAASSRWQTRDKTIYAPGDYAQLESVVYLPRNLHLPLGGLSKPTELMKLLLTICGIEGDDVLDPFCGSGSTLEAARQLGMNVVGIDKNPKHAELAMGSQRNEYAKSHL